MAYTETTHEGWFSRIGNAIKGVIFGVILVIAAPIVLFWNEGRAVHTAQTLAEGKSAVVSVDAAKIDPANEGKLVHFSAKAINAGDKLADPVFHVSQDAIHLRRNVSMYQWKEDIKTETHKDMVGGGQTTTKTATYSKVWSSQLLNSSNYKEERHENPSEWRISPTTLDASNVTAGAFTLNPKLVGEIDNYAVVPLSATTVDGLDAELKNDALFSSNGDAILVSNSVGQKPDPNSPKIGDLKVSFEAVPPGDVSVVAKQSGKTLIPYQTKNDTVELLKVGNHSAQEIFALEEQKNTTLTWILRGAGFIAIWIGLALILNPLKVLSDVISIVGDIVGAGIGIISGVIAIAVSFITIAIAWITYRPVVGVSLLVVALAAIIGFFVLRAKAQRNGRRPARRKRLVEDGKEMKRQREEGKEGDCKLKNEKFFNLQFSISASLLLSVSPSQPLHMLLRTLR